MQKHSQTRNSPVVVAGSEVKDEARDGKSHAAKRHPCASQLREFDRAFAAIDLGTNNCRMLIAGPGEDGLDIVDSFSRVVRLGEGLQATGRLSDEAMERTVGALKICSAKLRKSFRRRKKAALPCWVAHRCWMIPHPMP